MVPQASHRDFVRVVKISVGRKEAPFLVHPDIISRESPWFRTALEGEWKTKDRLTDVQLPADDPKTFALFLKWVYTEKLWQEDFKEGNLDFSIVVPLYLFAKKVHAPRCQNALLAYVYGEKDNIKAIPVETFVALDKDLDQNDGLARLIVNWFIINGTKAGLTPELFTKAPKFTHHMVNLYMRNAEKDRIRPLAFSKLEKFQVLENDDKK